MRWSSIALLAGLAVGCGASPLKLVREGRWEEALDTTYDADADTPEPVLRAVVNQEAPTLTIDDVEDDELARLVGGHTARALAPGWVLLRATLATRGRLLPQVSFTLEIGGDGLEVPSFPVNPIKRSDEANAPQPKVVLRGLAPRAAYLTAVLADSCDKPGACMRYFLLRRPLREDPPLSVRARVTLARTMPHPLLGLSDEIQAVVTAPLPSGPLFKARFPLALSLAQIKGAKLSRNEARSPSIGFCGLWNSAGLKKGQGPCLPDLAPLDGKASTLGLALPPPPPSLGSPAESVARRPWWGADETYAPAGAPPPTATQGAAADIELAVCKIGVLGIDVGWVRVGSPAADAWARIDKGTAVLPLAHVASGGALAVEVWDGPLRERALVGGATLERSGPALVASKLWTPRDLHLPHFPLKSMSCTPYDRAAVEAAAAARWPPAVDAVDLAAEDMDAFAVDLPREGFRSFPWRRVDAARAAISAVAALAGWSDPRVAALVARLDAIDASGASRIKAAVTAIMSAKKEARINDNYIAPWGMRVIGLHGGDQPPRDLDLEVTGFVAANFDIIMDDGHLVHVRIPEHFYPRSGETKMVTLTPERGWQAPPNTKPWVLTQSDGGVRWLGLVP